MRCWERDWLKWAVAAAPSATKLSLTNGLPNVSVLSSPVSAALVFWDVSRLVAIRPPNNVCMSTVYFSKIIPELCIVLK